MKTTAFLVISLVAGLGGCSTAERRMLRYGSSDINDFKIFPSRSLHAAAAPFRFTEQSEGANGGGIGGLDEKRTRTLDRFLRRNDTVAFVIIKDDVILWERYYQDYGVSSPVLSFSMAKSFLSVLIGCAIDDGDIRSVDEPVTSYVPELAANGFDRVTLKHLLQMTSGSNYVESDSPLTWHPHFYYGDDQDGMLRIFRVVDEPGTKFRYKSGDNQLLGLVLRRALETCSVTEYMQRRIWEPLGMEYDGLWSLDREDGMEKTFCCVAACARDFAKIGRLYLHFGDWQGKQIVSRKWVEESTRVDTSDGSPWYYQYQWWLPSKAGGEFMAQGHLGQYLYVNRRHGIILVRLGKSRGTVAPEEWRKFLSSLAEEIGSGETKASG